MTTDRFNPDYLVPGTRVGLYIVRDMLGQGGSSSVYEVQSDRGNLFAMKICRYLPGPYGTTDWRMDRRFTRSIICLEQLKRFRNVAEIFGHDRFPDPLAGYQYIVQELVPGCLNIAEWVRRQSPSLVRIVTAFQALAELCGELTRADIRHRDLKPLNILMAGDVPKVIDFDSATCFHPEALTRKAASEQPCTRGYYSPELCRAILEEKRTGRREMFCSSPVSDLHALGVVFYECLTGEHPFDTSLPEDLLLREIAYDNPLHAISINPAVPFGLNKVVMRLLEKDPQARYQDGDHVARDLRILLEEIADERWAKPFELPEPDDDDTPVRPSRATALVARTAEASTQRGASMHSPGWRHAWFAAVVVMAFVVGLQGAFRWPLPDPPAKAGLDGAITSATCGPSKGATVSPSVSDPSQPPPTAKKPLRRARNAAAIAAAATLCASCTGVKVRPEDDLAWLASCPAEARETVRTLGIDVGEPTEEGPNYALLLKGPNVLPREAGCEVREGEVRASALMHPYSAAGTLVGTAREGSDRVSFRFHELWLPDGRKLPICALGGTDFGGHGPGVAKAEDAPPASERTPGFLFITTGRIWIRVAPAVPRRES
jgi:eukaryotic-like serine/threonine-protein kinase